MFTIIDRLDRIRWMPYNQWLTVPKPIFITTSWWGTFFKLRFEAIIGQGMLMDFQKWVVWYWIKMYFPKKEFFSIYCNLYIIFNYLKFNYKSVRYMLLLPTNGQRTRSHKTKNNKLFLVLCDFTKPFVFKKAYNGLVPLKFPMLFYVEFLNKLWYYTWRKEWRSAMDKRNYFERNIVYYEWKFCWPWIYLQRPLTFIEKKIKTKQNKKKIILPKNQFNIGFFGGFTKRFCITLDAYKKLQYNRARNVKFKGYVE